MYQYELKFLICLLHFCSFDLMLTALEVRELIYGTKWIYGSSNIHIILKFSKLIIIFTINFVFFVVVDKKS